MPHTSSPNDLRRHVLDGPAEGVGPSLGLLWPEFPAEAEVSEDDVAVAVQEDVLELDVAVDDAVLEWQGSIIGYIKHVE